jgi:hypothetical protein
VSSDGSASTQYSRRDKVLPTELANYRSDDERRPSEQIIPRGWRDKIGSALKKSALIRSPLFTASPSWSWRPSGEGGHAYRVESRQRSSQWWRLSFASGHVSFQARFCHEGRIDLIWPCRWARLGWARRVPSGDFARRAARPSVPQKETAPARGRAEGRWGRYQCGAEVGGRTARSDKPQLRTSFQHDRP